LRGAGFLMAGQGEGVLVFAGDLVVAGDAFGGEAHGEQGGGVVLGHPGIGAGLEAAKREQAHGFDATGDDDAVIAGADALIGDSDGFKAGGTEAVDGSAGDFDRQARAQDGPAGDVPALLALGLGASEDDILDFGLVKGGNPVQCCGDGECGQVVRASGGEGAFGGATNGSSNGADENGFRHGWCSYAILWGVNPTLAAKARQGWGTQFRVSILHYEHNPCAAQIVVVDGFVIDECIAKGVVVKARGAVLHAGLRLADLVGRCGVDAPVEAENASGIVGLQALGFGRRGERERLAGVVGEEDQKRDGSL
jgi:hypothetical protein